MQVEAEMAQARAKELHDSTINYIDNYDRDALSKELEERQDPEAASRRGSALKEIQYKDEDYVKQLDICNKIWYLGGLIKELKPLEESTEADWMNIDFQASVKSLNKLRVKLAETIDTLQLHSQYIRLFDELGTKVKEDTKKLDEVIHWYIDEYLKFNDGSLTYTNTVQGMTFTEFLQSCNDFAVGDDSGLTRLFNFNRLFNNWVKQVLERADQGYEAKLQASEVTLVKCETTFESYTLSLKAVIEFFDVFLADNEINDSWTPFQTLRAVVGKTILGSLKAKMFSEQYVYPLLLAKLNESDDPTLESINEISRLLARPGWSNDGICDIEFWMDDLISCWVSDLAGNAMDEVKEVVMKIRWREYLDSFKEKNMVVEEVGEAQEKEESIEIREEEEEEAEENGWNDEWDDGWDKDEPGSPQKPGSPHKLASPQKPAESAEPAGEDADEGWDWNDDWDEKEAVTNKKEAEQEKAQRQSAVKATEVPKRSTFKHTVVSDEVIKIIDAYYEHLSQLEAQVGKKKDLEDASMQFNDGTKKLLTGFFMMVNVEHHALYMSPILFYNDYSHVLTHTVAKHQVDLTSCSKMIYGVIDNLMRSLSSSPMSYVSQYSAVFFEDGYLDSSVRNRKVPEFIRRVSESYSQINREFLCYLSLNEQLVSSIYLAVTAATYNSISGRLLIRQEYGSDECDTIGQVITQVLDATLNVDTKLADRVQKSPSYNKLEQVRLVIVSNLKEILGNFYEAKLYELDTHEIIGMIKALFVDSTKRQDVIDQILKARGEE